MTEKRANIEVIAPTIEEAIEDGIKELGLPRESVDIEILDEGSKGLFGIGNRQARIRLTIKPDFEPSTPEDIKVDEPVKPQEAIESPMESESEPAAEGETDDQILMIARDTVWDLLERMHIVADVTAVYGDPSDSRRGPPIIVDIRGDDLSILIGKRAETINALQYIASLIINKELGRSVPLVVDVEGYRIRREKQIRRLAQRLAEQVIQTGRNQALEPMPPNERRFIHIELRDNPDVYTESKGEGGNRKVVIYPKE